MGTPSPAPADLDFRRLEAGHAVLSDDRVFRYTLRRTWDRRKPSVAWIGLNPSTADEQVLDPTLRRVVRFSHAFGFGEFVMLNLFALRATNPVQLRAVKFDPVGALNDDYIRYVTASVQTVVAAWGVHGTLFDRDQKVRALLKEALDHNGTPTVCLGTTKEGHPKHPLYLPNATQPVVFPL